MATAPETDLLPVLADVDYFTDRAVLLDPYEYFDAVRGRGPVAKAGPHGITFVTGFAEAVEVLLNSEDFSAVIAVNGPVVPLPFEPEGPDITEQVDAHRDEIAPNGLMISYDGVQHANARSLLMRLFTPSRLRANEAYMHKLADQMVREMVARGGGDVIAEMATPFVTLVIADLLGVPEDDRNAFREVIDAGPPPGNMDAADAPTASHPLVFMAQYFARYIGERRAAPRDDVMTELATATFPDGTTPDLMEVVKAAMFLFAAGQDTSAKLVGNAMLRVAEDAQLQAELRADPSLIPALLEETLRLEGSTKMTSRLALRDTKIGDTAISVGEKVFIGLAAANRDPTRWEDPNTFRMGRPKVKEHIAFGRGAHTCAGAPLARVEVRVLFEKFLEHTSDIRVSDAHHGAPGARTIDYEPSFIIRGVEKLHIDLTAR
jgi:cytochrome P450